jgi:hypothetical protein
MYLKRILLVLITFITITNIQAQDSETRGLREFDRIYSYDGVSIQLVPSDKNEVVVSGPSTEKVVTQVSGKTLKVKMDFGSNFRGEDNHIVIYFSGKLKEIKATEGSSITSNHTIEADKEIKFGAIEGAEINLDTNVEHINSRIATGGEITLSGDTENVVVNINTGGSFNGKKLKSKYGEVKIATGGSAKVFITDILDASVTMGGNIYYYGHTKTVNESISLGGNIVSK